jgi:hypothetical protein
MLNLPVCILRHIAEGSCPVDKNENLSALSSLSSFTMNLIIFSLLAAQTVISTTLRIDY